MSRIGRVREARVPLFAASSWSFTAGARQRGLNQTILWIFDSHSRHQHNSLEILHNTSHVRATFSVAAILVEHNPFYHDNGAAE